MSVDVIYGWSPRETPSFAPSLLLTRGLFVQSLEGDARLALAARLQPDAVGAAGVQQAVGHVPRPAAEAAALVALQRGRCNGERKRPVSLDGR